ncbi:MAG: CidA/LrgA family protein [Spirochaetia bacterium]|jgi:holin-like protein|nr:CidA/LrgA family protein [Spirochaetia bacterium]
MKVFFVVTLASAVAFASELLSRLLLPMIPGSVIGIIVMTLLLFSNIVKYEAIADVSGFFLDNIVFFLIPVVVSSADIGRYAGHYLFKIFLLIAAGTIIVMLVTGITAQLLMKIFHGRGGSSPGSASGRSNPGKGGEG